MLIHIFFILFLVLLVPTSSSIAQQASMVWDEKTKSWVSTPAPTTPPPTSTTTQPQQTPPIVYQQPLPVTPAQSTVDFGTLATIITPLIAAIAGIFVKNRKDMEKKNEETKEETIKAIEAVIVPKL